MFARDVLHYLYRLMSQDMTRFKYSLFSESFNFIELIFFCFRYQQQQTTLKVAQATPPDATH